jgi:hypothetical protein
MARANHSATLSNDAASLRSGARDPGDRRRAQVAQGEGVVADILAAQPFAALDSLLDAR